MKKITVSILLMVIFLTQNVIALSSNTIHESEIIRQPKSTKLYDITYHGTTYVAVGTFGLVLVTNDLTNWAEADFPVSVDAQNIVWDGSQFVIPFSDYAHISVDGFSWEKVSIEDVAAKRNDTLYIFDANSEKYVATRDKKNYFSNYYVNSNYIYFPSAFRGEDEYKLAFSEDSASWEFPDELFTNPKLILFYDDTYYVYCVYWENQYYFGEKKITLEIKSSNDLRIWQSTKYEIATSSTDTVLLTSNNNEVHLICNSVDGTIQAIEIRADDCVNINETAIKVPFADYNKSIVNDGNIILLSSEKISVLKSGEQAVTEYVPKTKLLNLGQRANNQPYWSGREWFAKSRFFASDNIDDIYQIGWPAYSRQSKFKVNEEMKDWYAGKSLKFLWIGDKYIAYTVNIPRYYMSDSGQMFLISDDMTTVLQTIITPGYVMDVSFVDGVYYISVPKTYADSEARNIYYSHDLIQWLSIDDTTAVPVNNGQNSPFLLLSNNNSEKLDLLMNTNQVIPISFENVKPIKIDKIDLYYYMTTEDENTLCFSKDGIYWASFSLPFDAINVTNVFEYGNDLIVQCENKADIVCIKLSKQSIYRWLDTALAGEPPCINMNGKILGFETPPVVEDGRTLVPMRFLFEQMGDSVSWDDTTQSATVQGKEDVVTFSIDNTTANVNGKSKTMDVPARLINDKTMVPLRFLSEELGYTVEWDENTNIVTIHTE